MLNWRVTDMTGPLKKQKSKHSENVDKVEEFLKKNNITIVSDAEAASLHKAAKEEKSKEDDDTGEEEKNKLVKQMIQ